MKQTTSLEARLADQAKTLREQAGVLPPGERRDLLLRKARQADIALHLDDWLRSPGLRSPE
jgi:hypothetical protein